jgi:hypothetical protein
MTAVVMDGHARIANLEREARELPRFDRLVLQLRWGEGLNRVETALVLHAEPASVLAAEMRLRAWLTATDRISRSPAG